MSERFARHPEVSFAVLFGSWATGTPRPHSDIDLGVLFAADLSASQRFLLDVGLQAQAERWLHLAGECVLDLAHHLIADRGWRTPTGYRDAFAVLAAEGALTPRLATAMEGWAGLRNVLVHLDLDVDHERLWEVLEGELEQLVDYASALPAEADREG